MRVLMGAFLAMMIQLASANGQTCSVLVLDSTDRTAQNEVYSFTSKMDVASFFGTSGIEYMNAAHNFFDLGNHTGCSGSPTLSFVRFPITGARAHLFGGNIASTLSTLSGSGAVTANSGNHTWTSGSDTLTHALSTNASNLTTAINTPTGGLPVLATFTAHITADTCTFTGYLSYITLNVEANGTGDCASGPPIGAQLCDATVGTGPYGNGNYCTGNITGKMTGTLITNQETLVISASYENNNTTENPYQTVNQETFSMFLRNQSPNQTTTDQDTITAYYATLTVDSFGSGTIAAKQQISDGGTVSADACVIWAHLADGTGTGSTWRVICANPQFSVASESMTTTPSQVEVKNTNNGSRKYLEISVNNYSPYCAPNCSGSNASEIGYLTDVSPGTVRVAITVRL